MIVLGWRFDGLKVGLQFSRIGRANERPVIPLVEIDIIEIEIGIHVNFNQWNIRSLIRTTNSCER